MPIYDNYLVIWVTDAFPTALIVMAVAVAVAVAAVAVVVVAAAVVVVVPVPVYTRSCSYSALLIFFDVCWYAIVDRCESHPSSMCMAAVMLSCDSTVFPHEIIVVDAVLF